jgi:uncharacterized protein (UPF0332 family)
MIIRHGIMNSLDRTRDFRERHSNEKKELAKALLKKGDYAHAFTEAYLSIFYSTRILLLGQKEDSDNINNILDLSHHYFAPYDWLSVNIREILGEGKKIRDSIKSDPGKSVPESEAKRFVESAEKIYNEIHSKSADRVIGTQTVSS